MPIRFRAAASIVLCTVTIAISSAWASDISFSTMLQTNNQSMWGTGSSSVLDKTYFYGSSWNTSSSSGGFDSGCVNLGLGKVCSGKNGVQVTGSSNGKAGILFDIHQDSGTVTGSAAAAGSITVSDNPQPGSKFTVSSLLTMGPIESLTSTFSNASIKADLLLDAHAKMSGQSCVFGACSSASTGDMIGINNADISLFSYNLNGDNTLKAFGLPVPVFQFDHTINLPLIGSKLGDIRINNPDIELTGKPGTMEVDGPCILQIGAICRIHEKDTVNGLSASGGVADLLSVHADVLNMALNNLGLSLSATVDIPHCPLPLCTVGLDVGEINVGPTLGLSQSLFLQDPDPNTAQLLLHVAETGQTIRVSADGHPTSILFPARFDALHITPEYQVRTQLTDELDLTVAPDLDINFLKACLLGQCVGPLYQYCPTDLPHTDCKVPANPTSFQTRLFYRTFGVTLTADLDEFVVGNPDTSHGLDPTDPTAPGSSGPVPEPGSWMLGAIGLALIALARWPR